MTLPRSVRKPRSMSVTDFYNQLSPFYHLTYGDWEASVGRQGDQLDSVIRELWGEGVKTILDAACGMGTQAIGLAQRGYAVLASDISAAPLERAREEAEKARPEHRLQPADFRSLS